MAGDVQVGSGGEAEAKKGVVIIFEISVAAMIALVYGKAPSSFRYFACGSRVGIIFNGMGFLVEREEVMSAFEGSTQQQKWEEKELHERLERASREMNSVKPPAPRTIEIVIREIDDKIRTIEAGKAATERLAELRQEFANMTAEIEARVSAARSVA